MASVDNKLSENASRSEPHSAQNEAEEPLRASNYEFVDLVWPGKDLTIEAKQLRDGRWVIGSADPVRRVAPLLTIDSYGRSLTPGQSLVVSGDRLDALRSLSRFLRRSIQLAYLDLPRIGVDDIEASFRGDTNLVFSTWLNVVSAHIDAVEPLLRRGGVIVLHVGDLEEPFARMLGDQRFRDARVGTVIWQRAYAPRNMRNMKEFTATHDCLVIYALDRSALLRAGVKTRSTGFSNPDGDPREEWKAEHKGAKTWRKNSDFDTFVPPYRWRLTKGSLPKGIWRVSPLTGVLWGEPEESGTSKFTVDVADSDGNKCEKEFKLVVREGGEPEPPPAIPWVFEELSTAGALRITTEELPEGVKGREYMGILFAEGGKPYSGPAKRPKSGRYWEFARDTLLKAYQRDAVYLGKTEPTAIPHPKVYVRKVGEWKIKNQVTWWPGRAGTSKSKSRSKTFAGYTEDATKHLKALKELGLLSTEVSTAKPEMLLARLVDIFTEPGDIVLEAFGSSADLASVALKRNRMFVYLGGSSERSHRLLQECALPRLRAVVDGKDQDLEERVQEIRVRADDYIPFEGGGGFAVAEVGPWLLAHEPGLDYPKLNADAYGPDTDLQRAILSLEGFVQSDEDPKLGIAHDGRAGAVVLEPGEFLTPEVAAHWASVSAADFATFTIYYFRSSADFEPGSLKDGLLCRRVPYDLRV